jgi:Protein of unknown function (DUF3602)
VREGPQGDQGDGPFSTGVCPILQPIYFSTSVVWIKLIYSQRGGAGNVGSPHTKASGKIHDEEVIPEVALREENTKDYHIGRGGAGNELHDHAKGEHEHESLTDKLKHKVMGKK